MDCEICGRNSCIKSFHSLDEQERYDKRQAMSDNVENLRHEIQDLQDENATLKKEIQSLEETLAGEDL